MMLTYNPRDCSISYKTFHELKNDDIIYKIDYMTFDIVEYKISDVKISKVSEYDLRKNCYEMEFTIPEIDEYYIHKLYDDNCLIFNLRGKNNMFVTTDKRIAEMIIDIMSARNSYQWNCFSNIFGNPLAGKFEPKHVVLR